MIQETSNGSLLTVKVIPKAKRSELVGEEAGWLKVRIAAVPEQGKANDELIRLLSKQLNIAKSRLEVVSGLTSRMKKVFFEGLSGEELRRGLELRMRP